MLATSEESGASAIGLVASPRHWPGSSSTKTLLTGDVVEGLWFDRTLEYRARKRGETFGKFEFATKETVALSPLPCWENQPEHRVQSNVRALVKGIEAETDERRKASGRPPMGVKAILNQQPHDRPARSRRSPAPRFHARSGLVRKTLERAYLRFYWSYREAPRKLQEGLVAEFPPGCFPPPASFVDPHPRTGFG